MATTHQIFSVQINGSSDFDQLPVSTALTLTGNFTGAQTFFLSVMGAGSVPMEDALVSNPLITAPMGGADFPKFTLTIPTQFTIRGAPVTIRIKTKDGADVVASTKIQGMTAPPGY